MKKTLPTGAIVNELAGSSAFFQKPTTQKAGPRSSIPQGRAPSKTESTVQKKQSPIMKPTRMLEKEIKPGATAKDEKGKKQIDDKFVSGLASNRASTIERIRKVVKDGGREVAFTRLSAEEKQQIKDLVYTYGRQGIKTAENEIVRIALNYILEDYQESGKESVLERVIEALNA